jgi:aminotransferase EvaB
VFTQLGYPAGSLPETERAARECLALPMYPTLPEADQQTLVAALEAASQ